MTNQPDDMPPWRHIENAEHLLRSAEEVTARNLTRGDPSPTDALLAAIGHALIALVKTRKTSIGRPGHRKVPDA